MLIDLAKCAIKALYETNILPYNLKALLTRCVVDLVVVTAINGVYVSLVLVNKAAAGATPHVALMNRQRPINSQVI